MNLYKVKASVNYLISASRGMKPNYTSGTELPPFFVEAPSQDEAIDTVYELFTKIKLPYFVERPAHEDEWNYEVTLVPKN